MSMLPPRVTRPELLDSPTEVLTELAANLRDIRRLNRWFGGTAFALRQVMPLLHDDRTTVLDVATGSADIPRGLMQAASHRGFAVDVVGLDISDEILQEARRAGPMLGLHLMYGDGRALPYADGSFDLVMCNLALHHFDTKEASTVLREMWRVAAGATIITDVRRGYMSYAATWAVTRTVAHNRLTRHDGPLSVLRAYDRDEVLALAAEAGWRNVCHSVHPLFRQALVGVKDRAHD